MEKIALIIDDDRTERRMIGGMIRAGINLNIQEAENGYDALRIMDNVSDIALIILDLDMPVMDGFETLTHINQKFPSIPVIILTGDTDLQTAVDALKRGAVDFLTKPVEQNRLVVTARNALKLTTMRKELGRLQRQTSGTLHFNDMIGHASGLADTVKIGKKAAACDLPVLVTGETGTGKEMFTRAIHGESARAGRPFIPVNCGAIPEKLVESILFGHEKGSFTGAINKAPGKFMEANGGTIFLDEIAELPLEAQVKLLRVLQQGEIEPVGRSQTVPVDVRVVSATNCDLRDEVMAGRFREDLYFRLNVIHIDLPPLRARKADIPEIVAYFIEKFCTHHKGDMKKISTQSLDILVNHPWPGNVRELENVINRAIALSENDTLQAKDFSFSSQSVLSPDTALSSQMAIMPLRQDGTFKNFKELEQEIVKLALNHHGHNISQTARTLGIAKSTLYTKIDHLADGQSG